MRNALRNSRAFAGSNLNEGELADLTDRIRRFVPIAHPEWLSLPADVLNGLSVEQAGQFTSWLSNAFKNHSSLSKTDNQIFLFLIWTSQQGGTNADTYDWAVSDGGRAVFERAKADIRTAQATEQLVLLLLAILCYWIIPPPSEDYIDEPACGSYVKDFDAFLNNEKHGRQVLERMVASLLRVLSTKESAGDLVSFIRNSIYIPDKLLHQLDGFSDLYWDRRTQVEELGHELAFGDVSKLTTQH